MSNIHNRLNAMRQFFNSGKTKSYAFRKEQLRLLKAAIEKNEEALNEALFSDLHKSKEEVWITETGMVLSEITQTLENLEAWMKPQSVPTNLLNKPGKSYILYEPLGVTLIIAPWNYPFQLTFLPLVAAIAAGNCVVIKPSELAPATEAIMQKIIRAIFSEDYILHITGDGATLIPDMMHGFRFDHVFYTGSTAVGKIIYQQAAAQLMPVTLELGGKSPCIITANANLKVAAKRVVNARFSNAGQMCITPDYLLVHQSVKDAFTGLLKETIKKFYGPQPIASYDYGRIINKKQFYRLMELLKDAPVIYGGEHNEEALYIAPTLVDNPRLDSNLMKTEIFGPILPIVSYNTDEEATAIIQNNPNPLAFYIFTNNKREADRWLATIPFGGGCVNAVSMHFLNKNLPFGGRGNSGIGKYHGRFSFETFSHAKGILKAGTWPDLPVAYPSLKGKLNMLKKLIR